jgi:hypothetical protein
VGARFSFSRAVWFSLGSALALSMACAGRSTSLDPENVAGEGSGGTGDTGGSGGSGGSTTGAGATGSGATGGTGMGATAGSGATGGTGMGATGSGATGGTGMGATAGSGAIGGTGMGATGGAAGSTACEPDLDDRRCLIDSDCMLTGVAPCCGTARIYGVNRGTACAQEPVACVADCAGARWVTDTNEATFELGVVQVRCEFGEPGAGKCVSYVDLNAVPPATYCDGELCAPTEVCVHRSVAGGPAPPCEPPSDDGTCPPNYKLSVCPQTGQMGCVEERVPPPPQCVDIGVACRDTVTCDCLPDDICGPLASQCAGVMGRDVNCIDQSP